MEMTERQQQIVTIARKWMGTPYHHRAAVLGAGVDCVGLIHAICQELGVIPDGWVMPDYAPSGFGDLLITLLGDLLVEIPIENALPGDVLVLTVHGSPAHLAIKTDVGILHVAGWLKKVVEYHIRPFEEQSICRAYRIPEVTHEPGS